MTVRQILQNPEILKDKVDNTLLINSIHMLLTFNLPFLYSDATIIWIELFSEPLIISSELFWPITEFQIVYYKDEKYIYDVFRCAHSNISVWWKDSFSPTFVYSTDKVVDIFLE